MALGMGSANLQPRSCSPGLGLSFFVVLSLRGLHFLWS